MNSIWTISAAVRLEDEAEVTAALERYASGAPEDLTITEVLDAHGTHHAELRSGLIDDCRRAGLSM